MATTSVPVPPGAELLTPDEAVQAITTQDHPEAASGGIELDGALIELIRAGRVVAARFADGRLAFAPAVAE